LHPRDQVTTVVRRLKELNPEFDGKSRHQIEDRQVVSLQFSSAGVTNIAPVRALAKLRDLSCAGTQERRTLADLGPLRGLKLEKLNCEFSQVSDLSPLAEMPLSGLQCGHSQVSNLSSLADVPLTSLDIAGTPVSDLSPLRDMPLKKLWFANTSVTNFSPLLDLPLQAVYCEVKKESDKEVLAHISSLERVNDQPLADFWKRVGPPLDPFTKEVISLSAEQRLARVLGKLKELNPQFDGKETHKIENGAVTELDYSTVGVTNIFPVQSLKRLKTLSITPWSTARGTARGALVDMGPLRGLRLTALWCQNNPISDLSPLKGMPLTLLTCGGTSVSDLSPLTGMPLQVLSCNDTPVNDLAPLEGVALRVLWCNNTKVADLSPLKAMPLQELRCDTALVRQHADLLRAVTALKKINDQPANAFWLRLGVASSTVSSQKSADAAKAARPAVEQIQRFLARMNELNRGFTGVVKDKTEGNKVVEIEFDTTGVTDISPVSELI
jgi:Leucine-rich repeat (LRR) protein